MPNHPHVNAISCSESPVPGSKIGPSGTPSPLTHTVASVAGGQLPPHKASCHFCGYSRANLGRLYNCTECSNVFHESCHLGPGITEASHSNSELCTRCSRICCCANVFTDPSGGYNRTDDRTLYVCTGNCCKVIKMSVRFKCRASNSNPFSSFDPLRSTPVLFRRVQQERKNATRRPPLKCPGLKPAWEDHQ